MILINGGPWRRLPLPAVVLAAVLPPALVS